MRSVANQAAEERTDVSGVRAATRAGHGVQFFDHDRQWCDIVTRYVREGLASGQCSILVLTAKHRELLLQSCRAEQLDLERAWAEQRLVTLDAHELLAELMVGSMPAWEPFQRILNATLDRVREVHAAPIQVYTEMVDVLCLQANPAAAQQLEAMSETLRRSRQFSLLCSYSVARGFQASEVQAICDAHQQVLTGEAWPAAPPSDALAVQDVKALVTEIARRKDAERSLWQSRLRAELLYDLAGAVIRAERVEDVFEAALDALQEALCTERSSILIFDAEGVMRFRAWRGLSDEYRRAVDGHSPWARYAAEPQPLWVSNVAANDRLAQFSELLAREQIAALGFIPLVAAGRLVGKFMVYFHEAQRASAQELDIAQAIAHHVAAAVSRFAAVDELRESVRFNELFTAVLGHDLRNPLGAIMTSAQLASRRTNDERLIKPLSRIATSGERMSRMIDQLLDFTRARVGAGIPLRSRRIDVLTVVTQIVDELLTANSGASIVIERRGDTVGVWDEDRLAQILSNLVGNAVQHGGIAARVTVDIDGSAAAELRLKVHNGIGIPADLLRSVFEPMTGGKHRGERSQGLGLGLFITREVVKAHGGTIDVESSDAAGTTFTMSLPRHPPKGA